MIRNEGSGVKGGLKGGVEDWEGGLEGLVEEGEGGVVGYSSAVRETRTAERAKEAHRIVLSSP